MNAHLRHSLGFKTKCGLIVARHRGGNTPFNRYADSVSRVCHAVCLPVFLSPADPNGASWDRTFLNLGWKSSI